MKFKVAVVQFEIKLHDPESNLKKAESFIKKASESKADVIIFPENFVTGPIDSKLELVDEGKLKEHFQTMAKKYKIDIVAGSIIEKSKTGIYNTTYYITSAGKVRVRYRKVNLWHPEKRSITPGNEICVFNTRFGKIGIIICWDLAFPEIFRRMLSRGVNIVFCPSWWSIEDASVGMVYNSESEIQFTNSLCTARAFENNIVIIFCNAAGKARFGNNTYHLAGNSQICVPFKGAIAKIDNANEEMIIQEVDTKILKVAELAYKIRSDVKKRIIQ